MLRWAAATAAAWTACTRTGRPGRRAFGARTKAPLARAGLFYMQGTSRKVAEECSPRRKPWEDYQPATQAPQGRKKLIPNIPLLVRDLIPLKEGYVFLLKRPLSMVLLLRRNILGNRGHIRFAHTESALACLPGKLHPPLLVNPSRRIGLDDTRNLRRRMYGTNTDQHVHVIGCTVNDERGTVHLTNNASQVGEEVGTNFGSY